MKRTLLILLGALPMICPTARSADLPTTSMDHLYYLRTSSQHLRRITPDEMIEYCDQITNPEGLESERRKRIKDR